MEFSQCCRTCASESKQSRSIYSEIVDGKTIAEAIRICTQISLHEDEIKPKQICLDCVVKLESAYDFYNLVQKSEDKFDDLIFSRAVENLETKNDVNYEQNFNYMLHNHEVFGAELPGTREVISPTEGLTNLKSEEIVVDDLIVIAPSDDNGKSSEFDTEDEMPLKNRQRKSRKHVVKKKVTQARKSIYNNKTTIKAGAVFECYKCKLSLPSLQQVAVHIKEHDVSVKCRICLKKFTKCDYMQHLCTGSTIECQYCSKPFNTTVTLIKHINKNHKDHKNYKCKKCAKAFHMKVLLEWHKPTHNQEEKRFICDICDKRFRTRYLIKEHIEINHTDKRTFLCATCGKNFNNPTSLRLHARRHDTSSKPIQCPKCPKRFFDKYGLKKHIEVHDDAQYVCDQCGSVMRSKSSYQEHMRRHRNAKIFTCEVCSKQIKYSSYNFKLHMYTHTGEKPFKCPYCDRRYTQNADLNKHLRTHVGQNTYKCEHCDKSFRLLYELRRHECANYQQDLTNESV